MANSIGNGNTKHDNSEQQEMRRIKPPPTFKAPPNALISYQPKPKDPPARSIKYSK